jgi:hypothetical protein
LDQVHSEPPFLIWRNKYLKLILNESEYYRATLAAEKLKEEGVISNETWREMVRQANDALIGNKLP